MSTLALGLITFIRLSQDFRDDLAPSVLKLSSQCVKVDAGFAKSPMTILAPFTVARDNRTELAALRKFHA